MSQINKKSFISWSFILNSAIEQLIKKDFYHFLTNWCALGKTNTQIYQLENTNYFLFIIKKHTNLSQPVLNTCSPSLFPRKNHPTLDKKNQDELNAWRLYIIKEFHLEETDLFFIIPFNNLKDDDKYESDIQSLSTYEKEFINIQINFNYKQVLEVFLAKTSTSSVINPNLNIFGNNNITFIGSSNSIRISIDPTNSDEIFKTLISLINNKLDGNLSLIQAANEMKENCGTSNFKEKYKSFISLAADHMTIFLPLIPFLTQFL